MSADSKHTIFILIEDEDLSLLFAELVEAHGREAEIVRSEQYIPLSARVLTEPRYYQSLSDQQKESSLVIGNKTALESICTPTLARPLTEEKIISALDKFLS